MALLQLKPFVDFLGQCADRHDGYIMGAVGQDPKELHEWYFNQYKDRSQYSAKQEAQALKWRESAEHVWDCQGLADGYLSEALGVKINVRARNNYASWCGIKGAGDIPEMRRVPGAAVFMDNGSYIHHVGFLEKPVLPGVPGGDWWVVEAQGVLYGVVRTKLSKRNWNRWGWMTKYFEYEETAIDDTLPAYGWCNLRRGMVGENVKALQMDLISLNYSVGKWGADGEFGTATEGALEAFQLEHGLKMDGVAGPETFAKLDELLKETGVPAEPDDTPMLIQISAGKTWNIRTGPSDNASVMGIAKRGELYAASGDTADGWIGIMIGGERAWISAKAVGK
jgi:hypothetical protein